MRGEPPSGLNTDQPIRKIDSLSPPSQDQKTPLSLRSAAVKSKKEKDSKKEKEADYEMAPAARGGKRSMASDYDPALFRG